MASSEIEIKVQPIVTYEDFERRFNKFGKTKGLTYDNLFEIKDLYVDCLSQEEIVDIIKKSFDIGDKLAMEFDALGYYVFKNNFSLRADDIIAEHIKRYDLEIKRLRDFVPTTSNPAFARKIANETKLCLLDTLHQKEKLLGFHTKNFSLKIYNTININNKKIKKDNFDLNKLTLNEKIEFVNLINKATKTEEEMDPGFANKSTVSNKKNENTIDIEYEEVSKDLVSKEKENLNIDRIEVEEIDEKIDDEIIIDGRNSVIEKLKETLRKKAEEEFSKLKNNKMPSEQEKTKQKKYKKK